MVAFVTGIEPVDPLAMIAGDLNSHAVSNVVEDKEGTGFIKGIPIALLTQARELESLAYLNGAQCCLQLNNYSKAISFCNKVLRRDKTNVKALFRRAKAYYMMNNPLDAQEDIETIKKIYTDKQEQVDANTLHLEKSVLTAVNKKDSQLKRKLQGLFL